MYISPELELTQTGNFGIPLPHCIVAAAGFCLSAKQPTPLKQRYNSQRVAAQIAVVRTR